MHATSDIAPEVEVGALTILMAEDEVLVRMMTSDHLRSCGFHVLEAANGEEARKIIGSIQRIDLVFSDVHMASPVEGIELARWLAHHYPDTPVILTSGSSSIAAGRLWQDSANVTDFVPKPYSVDDVERLVRLRAQSRDAAPK